MSQDNIASSGYTAMQVGRVLPADEHTGEADAKTKSKKSKKDKGATFTNIVSGNARVGMQCDSIDGNLTINM